MFIPLTNKDGVSMLVNTDCIKHIQPLSNGSKIVTSQSLIPKQNKINGLMTNQIVEHGYEVKEPFDVVEALIREYRKK